MKNIILILSNIILYISIQAQAQYGAVSTATAGSGRAAIEATEAPILNPASIPFSKGYFFTTDFANIVNGHEYTVAITDNMPATVVPTSLIYSQLESANSKNINQMTQNLHLAFGNSVTKDFSFGLAVEHKIDTVSTSKYFQTNLMFGTLFGLSQNLAFAVVADNVLPIEGAVPSAYRLNPTTSFGLSYNYHKVMRFKLDLDSAKNNSFAYPSLAAGLETYWNRWIIFRLGAGKDFDQNINKYGGGVGFSGPKFAIQYGYLSSPEDLTLARHSIDLAVPIW